MSAPITLKGQKYPNIYTKTYHTPLHAFKDIMGTTVFRTCIRPPRRHPFRPLKTRHQIKGSQLFPVFDRSTSPSWSQFGPRVVEEEEIEGGFVRFGSDLQRLDVELDHMGSERGEGWVRRRCHEGRLGWIPGHVRCRSPPLAARCTRSGLFLSRGFVSGTFGRDCGVSGVCVFWWAKVV